MPSLPSSSFRVFRCLVAMLSAGLLSAASAAAIVDVDVTTCGQTVQSGTRGRLVADLDCTGAPGGTLGGVIVLLRGAQLDLGGFTLTPDAAGAGVVCGEPCGDQPELLCKSACKIAGSGGTIAGGGLGIVGASVDVRDVVISGAVTAIAGWRKLVLRSSTLVDNVSVGVFAPAITPKIYDSSITNSGVGVNTGRGAVLKSSTVTGNVYGDLITSHRPKLVSSTCEVSLGADSGTASWGVCTLD